MDRQPEGESSQVVHAEMVATDEPEVLVDKHSYERITETLGNIPGKPEHGPKMNSESTATNRYAPTHVTDNRDNGQMTDVVLDVAVSYHPSYFHLRMYGEADYFMVSDLKCNAERHFCESFLNSTETLPFAEIVEEVCSTQANYHGLRQLAIEMIVDNLPLFRNRTTPMFVPELMKLIPDFTYDLFQATVDKCVDGSSSMEKN
ncbi:uncharacterized protein N7529_001615 [Penicillium soppii]|uniref:uncharacterized protein n=1 Tax=Penicillium soppii TaxID=69789 RepID=UPI00254865E3|nr:uncharacterized protein N7529_001615 [Penicillium soppii]KAJ5876031.1 hypothetical protein N7529_001615 [Penicillium soppii]